MPTNLFEPKDNYNLNEGQQIAALIKKFFEAKLNNKDQLIYWGRGTPLGEFLYIMT